MGPLINEHIYLDESQNLRIELICKRLSNSVNQIDIINWLGNFKKQDFDKAIRILENLEYVTENELVEHFNNRIQRLIDIYGNKRDFIVHPIGDYGKSATMITYYFKKAPNYELIEKRSTFFPNPELLQKSIKENKISKDSVLILIDDFLGSGKSLWKHYEAYILEVLGKKSNITDICALSIYHLNKAENFLTGILPNLKIISDKKYQCFKNGKSPFGCHESIQNYRSFAVFYGKSLFRTFIAGEKKIHPLGFNNSQALIVFPYNPPNNTLPIIWSSKKVKRTKRKWIPLYPRNQTTKVSRSKTARNQLAYELGLLKTCGSELSRILHSGQGKLEWKSYTFIKSVDFKLFAFLKLKQQKRVDQVICEILGINHSDLAEVIKLGVEREILFSTGEMTPHGLELYQESLRSLKRLKKETGRSSFNNQLKQINYIPTKFNGKER